MEPLGATCSNCLEFRRSCSHAIDALRCQRCIDFKLQGCDIADQIASLPQQTVFVAGQSSQRAPPQEEVPQPSQNPKLSELKWENLAKGECVLVIGVDIGTKNSSACWQVVPKDQKLDPNFRLQVSNVVSAGEWRIHTQAAISLGDDHPRHIFSATDIKDHLGDDLEPENIFTLLKLMLVRSGATDNNEERRMIDALQNINNSIFEKHLQAQHLPPNMHDVLDTFREFLRYLWSIIRGNIASAAPLSREELRYVLKKHTRIMVAVPAIWTATMNNHFRRLLLDAGFPRAHIRSEFKLAAAVIAQEQQQESGTITTAIKRAEILERLRKTARVVVDIGGRTTDLNCIQIVQTWKVFKFRTLMVGIGSMSGSELLNLLFKEKLSVILSDQLPRIAAAVDMTSEEVLQSFVQRFEKAKRTFSGDTTGMLKISFEPVRPIVQGLPRIPELHVGVKFIRISALEIREVFDKVSKVQNGGFDGIEKIAIMLVGGGSLIPYIHEVLKDEYTSPGIEVTQHDDNNCSLVAKGAVLAAIDPTLGLREFARTTYGTVLSIQYDPETPYHVVDKHLRVRAPSYIDWVWELPNRFHVVIKHGTNLVNPSKPVTINETIDFRTVEVFWPLELEHKIYQVDDPAWGLKNQFWSIREAPTSVVHTATLTIKVARSKCQIKVREIHGVRCYRTNFRARPEWDGLCEKWLFFVHPTGKKIVTQKEEDESFCAVHVLDECHGCGNHRG